MKKKITASVTFIVQDNSHNIGFGKPLELMDPDNFREAFVESVEEAQDEVVKIVEDGLGISGGAVLGHVTIQTENIE